VAVFSPAVFASSVPAPTPVQKLPLVRFKREYIPTAVLYVPVLRLKRALCPSAVLPPAYPPSGGGLTACDFGKKAKHVSETMMRSIETCIFMARSFTRICRPCRERKHLLANFCKSKALRLPLAVFPSFRVFCGQFIPITIMSKSKKSSA
jgi:hypothetical protein